MRNKLYIATPTRGQVSVGYCHSVWQLLRYSYGERLGGDVGEFGIERVEVWPSDVVRVRNRFAKHFLSGTNCSHLLFIDDDVEVPAVTVAGMLACDRDFVASPYPQRMGIQWDRVRGLTEIPPEAAAYKYNVRLLDETKSPQPGDIADDMTLEVRAMPLGCALIKRSALQQVADQCTRYVDRLPDGTEILTPNMFGLVTTSLEEGAGLLSEDYSFCHRWRGWGKKIHLYLGEGSPVTHHGSMAYRGYIEAFGLVRGPVVEVAAPPVSGVDVTPEEGAA